MFFLGLRWEPHLKTGFLCLFGLFCKIMPISSIWKRDFLFLGLWWQPLGNNINIFYLKTEFPCFFLGLWWEPHLKTGFPCLFRLFWKIMPISSIWKRDFPFLGLWWEHLENNANIFYLKTEFPCFFWACDGNLIWKPDFRVFLGFSGK